MENSNTIQEMEKGIITNKTRSPRHLDTLGSGHTYVATKPSVISKRPQNGPGVLPTSTLAQGDQIHSLFVTLSATMLKHRPPAESKSEKSLTKCRRTVTMARRTSTKATGCHDDEMSSPVTIRHNSPSNAPKEGICRAKVICPSNKIKELQEGASKSSKTIKRCKMRLSELKRKPVICKEDYKVIENTNKTLLNEMRSLAARTEKVQEIIASQVQKFGPNTSPNSGRLKDGSRHQQPDFLARPTNVGPPCVSTCIGAPSATDLDLSRKLTESYHMQELLVADNANLEKKGCLLYKELLVKDQNLELCRTQIKRLQTELKMLTSENSRFNEKCKPLQNTNEILYSVEQVRDAFKQVEYYKKLTSDLEIQLVGLENEVKHFKAEMAEMQLPAHACQNAGKNICHQDPSPGKGPPIPPLSKACGVCPPCPAPCNPNAPPTPAEKEVVRLTIQLRTMEENFKSKVTECAMLRADLVKKKEEFDKERCLHKETAAKLRELEMKFEGLAMQTNMNLGTKEQAFEHEMTLRALKACYRDAREEIDELRVLLKEQNEQIQDYRVKYLQAQQLVEEQKRQMDMMDMDNTRISEQINMEIQKVKVRFQEKLQELAPIPDLLKATQMRLKDAQQSQAVAEHNAEMLSRELMIARERIHALLHNSMKPPEKPAADKNDEKAIALLQGKITQLQELNAALKSEVDRLKSQVIRMEDAVLMNEKRLQEKMHECAALGGELDRARDEAARALQRANDRTDTMKKCLQTTVAELERQLAAARAQVVSAEKEREEIRNRMQCQIGRLNDNFEQAQLRIFGLQTQVATLRRTKSEDGGGESDSRECACKSFFDRT